MENKKIISLLLILCLCLSFIEVHTDAKAKPKLNKTKITMYSADCYEMHLSNAKSKVKWKLSSKKYAYLADIYGGKNQYCSVLTRNKIANTTITLTATSGKKKYKCKITLKKKSSTANSTSATPAEPTATPVVTPTVILPTLPIASYYYETNNDVCRLIIKSVNLSFERNSDGILEVHMIALGTISSDWTGNGRLPVSIYDSNGHLIDRQIRIVNKVDNEFIFNNYILFKYDNEKFFENETYTVKFE